MSATLSLHDLTVSRGARTILDSVDLLVAPGDRVGVVGPNGVGKSTLLAAAAGELSPDSGEVRLAPPSANVGWLRQEPDRSGETVRDLLHRRTGVTAAQLELDTATALLVDETPASADRYDRALQRWLALGAADLDARLGAVAADLGMSDRLLDQPTSSLSGGEAARAGLAALLLSQFDVYLLDEPTNDLDLDGLDRLERWVLGLAAPVLLVSHDRRFLDRVITGVAEIDEFTHRLSVFGGGWQAYLDERERARRHAWEAFEEYDTKRRDLAGRAQQQREWAQQGQAKVRRSGENDKHIRNFRMDQTEQLAGKSAQTKRAAERLEVVDKPREPWELRLDIPTVSRSGDVVARLAGAVVDRGDFRLGPIDLLVSYGDRIALVGHNGAGKSTLIDLLLGRVEARTLLAKFGLVGDHIERPTASLSPGERTRASLALLMANGANLLVLDEPTNHLDLPAIEQLEQALDTFAGTVLVVSHDREFLDHIRTSRTVRLDGGRVVGATQGDQG